MHTKRNKNTSVEKIFLFKISVRFKFDLVKAKSAFRVQTLLMKNTNVERIFLFKIPTKFKSNLVKAKSASEFEPCL